MRDPLVIVLICVVVFALIGTLPAWPHSRGWGYGPGGILGLVLIVILILILMGRV